MSKATQLLNGTNGKIYLDGAVVGFDVSCEFKITREFAEVTGLNFYGVYQNYGGYTLEGTITKAKIDSDFANTFVEETINGTPSFYDLIIEVKNPYTSKSEMWKLTGVVFTEYGLSLEHGENIQEELPFKAEEMEIVESL